MFCADTLDNFFTAALYNEGFLHSGVIGFTGGAILGQLFEMRFVKINLSYSLWNRTTIPMTLIRIFLQLLAYLVFAIPYSLLSSDVPESQLPLLFLGKYFLPCFLSTFVFFAFARVIFMKMRLINERSIGGQFEVSVSS
jgi:hypothetical protein